MLVCDGSDDTRIDYIKGFMSHYYEKYYQHAAGQADSPSIYDHLQCLIPTERLPEVSNTALLLMPTRLMGYDSDMSK